MAFLSFKTKAWSAIHTKRARSFYFGIGRFYLCIAFVEAGSTARSKDDPDA